MDRAFLGVGWRFPLQVTPSGAIAQSRDEQKIEESIYLILGTAQARTADAARASAAASTTSCSRPNNATTVAEVVDNGARGARPLRAAHRRARGRRRPPRPESDNVLLIRIDYRVRANNARGNLVYPFFITEGT